MSKFTTKSSYSLLKTNPKLTGNVKLVVDSNDFIYLESIDASPELTRNKYKKVPLNLESNWSNALYTFFNNGSLPSSIVYALQDNEDFYSIKKEYAKQYYTPYQQGASPKISKLYDEQISYFAPIWLEPNDIPEHFAIFKIQEPVSVSTKNETEPFNQQLEDKIYNTNYFENEPNSTYFFDTILSKSKLLKVYDLGQDTTIGKYLRNHINDTRVPNSSLTIDWNNQRQSTINGISLTKSGFVNESFNLFSEAFPVDRTVTEMDSLITKQFEINNVIHPNIINLEFLFDDEEDDDYTINRYFGVYFNRKDITKFTLDSEAFYTKKYENLPQNKNILSKNDIDIVSDKNIFLENKNGVKLFIDYENNYELLSSDIKGKDTLPYVYSTDGNFFDINNSIDWNNNEVVLKDTSINTNEFKGFAKESVGIIPSTKTNVNGRSYFEFTIEGTTNSFELRIRSVDEKSSDFDLNQVFIGDIGLEPGTFNTNKFSLSGTPENIANAIVGAVNNYSIIDEDFNIFGITKFNRVIFYTRGENEYWNNYEYLLFSKDVLFDNVISFPNIELETLSTFNQKRLDNGQSEFMDYDSIVSGATAMFSEPEWYIIQKNLTGGNNTPKNRIRIPIEFKEYFDVSLFMKSLTWYTPIISIDAYLDEPIYQNGRIVNFNNIDSYLSINCNDDVFITKGAYCEIFEIENNKVGLMSLYPVKQFDVDQFRSTYGRDGDGYIDLLQENYIQKSGATGASGNLIIENSIQNFKDTGFKRLGGVVNEDTGEIPKIENEYNRLKENEVPELSIKGRIIPYINKWIYDDTGKDVRENPYRLTSNSAFSYDNFSPSNVNKIPDFRYFTHEWYYLQKYPYYLSTEEKINSFSYFDRYLDINEIYDINTDVYFTYFTQNKVDGISFPNKFKYSVISAGNEDKFGETFFRGAKIKFKRRTDTSTELDFNIENIGVFSSDEFNDYKFSAVFNNNSKKPLSYNVIENKKFKSITFFIEANLDDYYLTRSPSGELFLDRSSLYIIESKYDSDGEVSDTELSGAICPYITDSQGNNIANFRILNINGENIYEITGVKNTGNGSIPNYDKQVLPNETGGYNDIKIEINASSIINITGIISSSKNTIRAKAFTFNGTPFTITYKPVFPRKDQCDDTVAIYLSGGFNAYKGTIEDISFASIYDKVNNGSPDINYITVNEDGSIENNTFLIEFEPYSTNAKADYSTTNPIIFNGIKNSDFKPIGSNVIPLKNTLISAMFRFNGNYNPKVDDTLLFNDDFGNSFNEEIRDNLEYTNTQFFSTYPGFALYKQLYINKINEQNPLAILDLNKDSALRPEFWKVGEISLDKQDSYIFRSCWDHNYHKKYDSKVKFISYPGYIEPKEVSSFLASTIMNIPDAIKIDTYHQENIKVELVNNTLQGNIQNRNELIKKIVPNLEKLFVKYVNDTYNYRRTFTLDDDIIRYIETNILIRYFLNNNYAYVKFSNKNSDAPLVVTNKSEQELILDGFTRLDNIRFSQIPFNPFDISFVYNKPSDKNVTLAFVSNIQVI